MPNSKAFKDQKNYHEKGKEGKHEIRRLYEY
jgi:hypothetical protein